MQHRDCAAHRDVTRRNRPGRNVHGVVARDGPERSALLRARLNNRPVSDVREFASFCGFAWVGAVARPDRELVPRIRRPGRLALAWAAVDLLVARQTALVHIRDCDPLGALRRIAIQDVVRKRVAGARKHGCLHVQSERLKALRRAIGVDGRAIAFRAVLWTAAALALVAHFLLLRQTT